jgi:hypothetical protein
LRASVASDAEANREDRVEVVVTQDVLQMSAVVATAIRPHDGRARPQPRHPDGSVRPTSIISSSSFARHETRECNYDYSGICLIQYTRLNAADEAFAPVWSRT